MLVGALNSPSRGRLPGDPEQADALAGEGERLHQFLLVAVGEAADHVAPANGMRRQLHVATGLEGAVDGAERVVLGGIDRQRRRRYPAIDPAGGTMAAAAGFVSNPMPGTLSNGAASEAAARL